MRINISKKDCSFYVDEEKRKVVCVIPDTQWLVLDYISDAFDMRWSDATINKLMLPTRFVGVATCSKEDEFNEEIGREIAFNKAKFKLNTSFFKRADWFINELDKEIGEFVQSVNNFGAALTAGAERREEKIKAYFGETNA